MRQRLGPFEPDSGAAAGEQRRLAGRLRAVIEAKDAETAALYGDWLYDAAWLIFWWPWFPQCWNAEQLPDGSVRWTAPSGRQYVTEPTRYPI
jgi:hypothetical protein